MPTPLNNRARKLQPTNLDPDLEKVLTDYSEQRVMYETIQLQHPSFTGQPDAVNDSYYLVNHTDKVIRGGITYINFAYALELPTVGENQQTIGIALDNIDQLVQKGIEKAITNPEPIKLIYRIFIEGSADVKVGPVELQVEQVSVTDQSVNLQCSRPDLYARSFPKGVRYDQNFRGLFA